MTAVRSLSGFIALAMCVAAGGCGGAKAPSVAVWPVPAGARVLQSADESSAVSDAIKTRYRVILIGASAGVSTARLRRSQTDALKRQHWRPMTGTSIQFFSDRAGRLRASVSVASLSDLAFEPPAMARALTAALEAHRPALLVTISRATSD